MKPTRSVLKWHGGKWRIAPWIISHLPPHRVYVEPYGGGGSVLLRKARSHAEVYNDLDGDVVLLFRILRDNPAPLIAALELTPYARDEYELSHEPCENDLERARRLCVRSLMGFGSRGHNIDNKTGFRNFTRSSTTYPAKEWHKYPASLPAIVERLLGVTIENREAREVMLQHDSPATLHYVDPPYVPDTRSALLHNNGGYTHEMTDADHMALAECLHGLAGMVVLSGYRSDSYDDLFKDWQTLDRETIAESALPRTETLWFNPAAWAALHHHDNLFVAMEQPSAGAE